MTDASSSDGLPDEPRESGGSDDLLSALEVIEDQPLADRAPGYAALHEELSRRLEAAQPGARS